MEVCIDNAWTAVSEYQWDYDNAQVVCRQLNLPHQCNVAYFISVLSDLGL